MVDIIGGKFDGYGILEALESHGGCQAYKAISSDGKGIVALKIFPKEIGASPGLLQKLRASLDSIERMRHRSILPVVGLGLSEGYPFIVMPYNEAGSLQDRIDLGILSALNNSAAIREIASALELAHSHGLVHGNLRPSNILFDENGNIQLMGQGEACLLSLPSYREASPNNAWGFY